tara:strand:+ start:7525 stop:7956 length:432 start_codon:yes stop_codon:yes gene_type:complete
MSLTYSKITYNKIEDRLRDFINDYFKNVYISSKYKKQSGNESIRITVTSVDTLNFSQQSEELEYSILVRYYLQERHTEKGEQYAKARTDRLKKLISDNIKSFGNMYGLYVDSIEYFVSDDENEDNEELQIIDLNVKCNYLYVK